MTPQAPGQEEFEDVEYSKIFDLAVLRLAALESHAYESVRKKEAVKLNVRVSALDAEVKKARRSAEAEPKANGEDADQPQLSEAAQDTEVWKSASGLYQISNGRTYRINYTKDAEIRVPLANFSARIVEETTFDDGVEVTKFFTVEGQMHTGRMLPLARVPVTKYGMMNWTADVWGFGPSMSAGQGAKDHLRCAIDEVSGDVVPCRSVFTHLGWRKAPGWVYLHSGGAVCGEGLSVEIETPLDRFTLPEDQGDPIAAMRLSLKFLELGPATATYPLWSAIWRAVLCEWLPSTVVLWVMGETGTLKSSVSAIALSHFGGPFDKDHLPSSWLDTENRLEQQAFLCKDSMLIIDDFCPERHAGLAHEMERRASRIIRAIGNRQARGRLRSDLTTRRSFIPRGLVVSTAEQLPNLAPSALARIMPVPFEDGDIDKKKLTPLQTNAALLPYALRGFLEWLQPQANDLTDHLRGRFEALRADARIQGHDRIPENVAHLFIGLEFGVGYAEAIGALDKTRAQEILRTGWTTLMGLAGAHAKVLVEERPTKLFLRAIKEGIASEKCWVADRTTGSAEMGENKPGSDKLGWMDNEGVYLLPSVAHAFTSDHLRHRGGVVLGERALRQMLLRDGVLLRKHEDRLDTKVRCEGKSIWVLWLRPDAITDEPSKAETKTA